ncbi:MAG: hypothetical protein Tp170SUR191951_44 [Prokaryotic dsDNA virus sp.]|nr:hypothetical protein [Pseudomonas sp.]MBS67342.1 hypothetical protein [Pseudomonas sp.]QDP55206.1 MAG: hypothetical protein Tp170SUR191951_44 [Prokaryotic dsDNA virus sp.]|tara:strand:- start:2291 stop:2917 length:627 start_codon:yes stop_codon:yes gene_type:complete
MTDRGIIFSGPMICALVDGRKTQTRRLASSPLAQSEPGDRLWVRETFRAAENDDGWDFYQCRADGRRIDLDQTPEAGEQWGQIASYGTKAGQDRKNLSTQSNELDFDLPFAGPWVPSIHMPRWASRLTLTVTDVRLMPLQSISREDARAEGHWMVPKISTDPDVHLDAARDWFMDLWDSLHDKPGERWADNPDLVALTFTVEERNIDR